MSLYPGARVRLLPDAHRQPAITPAIIIDHTQAGSGSLYGWWTNPGSGGLECHLWVGLDGTVEQYVDTHRSADANYKANRWTEAGRAYGAISIETENTRAATNAAYRGGKGAAAFDADPWTPAQLDALEDLHDWLADEHPEIRRQRANAPTVGGRGLGYHSMWGTGPTDWIPYSSRGKTCPGRERIRQWNDRLLPAFVRSTSRPTPTPKPAPGGLTVSEAKAIREEQARQTKATVEQFAKVFERLDAIEAENNRQNKAMVERLAGIYERLDDLES